MDQTNDFDKRLSDQANRQIEDYEQELQSKQSSEQEQAVVEEQSASTSTGTKSPKNFNAGDNIKELGKATVGGVIDMYNSVGSLPKLLDKRFYQPTDPKNPWTYDAPWLIKNKPITQTTWGSFIRGGIELAAGAVGVGKVAWGVKGLKGVATAAKVTRAGRVALGAAQGAAYDVISNQSQEANLARSLIDIKPQWSNILEPIATKDTMSPAMKAAYNTGDGLGIGGFLDLAFEGIGLGVKSIGKNFRKAQKKAVGSTDKLYKALYDSGDLDYENLTNEVTKGAKAAYERSLYRKFKNQANKLSKGTRVKAGDRENYGTIVGFEKGKVKVRFVNPQTKKTAVVPLNKGELTVIGGNTKVPSIAEWRGKNKPWEALTDEQREGFRNIYAEKNNIDWGEERNFGLNTIKQGEANKELAIEQLEFDLSTNKTRQNPAYYEGGDISDNQALMSTTNPVKGVRDMIEIRNNPTQKYGSPEGTITEANIRRAEYTAPGMMLNEVNTLAKYLEASPPYQILYKGSNANVIEADLRNAAEDLIHFMNDTGNGRLTNISKDEMIAYIKNVDTNPSMIEGLPILNKAQLNATDLVLGQLLFEARDLAKGALSVHEVITPASPGGMLDGILSRYSAIARLRKETSIASSYNLRRFRSGKNVGKFDAELVGGEASDAAAEEIATFKQLLKGDVDNDLLESFIHFTATGNGQKQTFTDLEAFFKKKLHGYKNADGYQRNAIINELMTMGINSILSGPKTVVRALVGTGLGTAMRPVATILGARGEANDQVFRGAMASIGGMLEARNDAWRKAVKEFQAYNLDEKGFRGFTETTADQEWNAMMSHFNQHGTMGEKAMAITADHLRNLNKSPFLNYGPRTMKAMDAFFSQIIGRGRQRQLAFDDVYTKLKDQGHVVSDLDLDDLVKKAEVEFESKVFSADGQITDEMASFAADEAKLTKELTGFARDLDQAFDKMPYLKPFFLFARTGVNALVMTSKYTPLLNSKIREHVDIMTKNWDDPDMLKYGIKSQNDLNIAKATMKGRQAIGWGVTSTAATMAYTGAITGNGPPDRQLRDSWIAQGWQPRSIKIGGSYISYEALEPFNMFFSFAADVVDAQKVMGDDWANNQFGKMYHLISGNIINKSFLAGLMQLQDTITSGGQDFPRVAANFVNNQIPLAGLRNEIGKVVSPGMRELESGFWQSVGNRNLWVDLVTENGFMPYRYDYFNGEKLRDWDPMTRLTNAVLPINLNIGATNETRELLMRSGLNLRQTFNTGPRGQILENRPDLKSKFGFYMGQQNIESQIAEVMDDDMKESIRRMETNSRKDYDAKHTPHGKIIWPIIRTAKQTAWELLLQDPELGGDAQILDTLHQARGLRDTLRSTGQYEAEEDVLKEIEELKNIPK